MRYKLLFKGGKEVIINQGPKEEIEKLLFQKIDTFITVEGELVKTSDIKAILKHYEQGIDPLSAHLREQENQAWHQTCLKNANRSAEEKSQKELDIRILPGWKMAKLPEDDPVLSDIYVLILNFFDKNPTYPCCPMRIWWPLVADKIAPIRRIKVGETFVEKRSNPNVYMGKWFDLVDRNDKAVESWIRWNH